MAFQNTYNDANFLYELAMFAFYLPEEVLALPQYCHDGYIRKFGEQEELLEHGYEYRWHVLFLTAFLRHISWTYQDCLDTKRDIQAYIDFIRDFTADEVNLLMSRQGVILSSEPLNEAEITYSTSLAIWILHWFFEKAKEEPPQPKQPVQQQKKAEVREDSCDFFDRGEGIDISSILKNYKTPGIWKESLEE